MRTLLFVAFALTAAATAVSAADTTTTVNWVFDERRVTGATRWGHIKPNPTSLSVTSTAVYPLCSGSGYTSTSQSSYLGATQSPINIQRALVEPSLPRLSANWIDAHTFEISNDGVEVIFTPKDVVPSFVHPTTKDTYDLLYWRLVAPSGHSFGSGPRSAEFQLVHQLSTSTQAPGTTQSTTTGTTTAVPAQTTTTAAPASTPSPTTQGAAGAKTVSSTAKYAIVVVTMDAGFGPHEYLSALLNLIPEAPEANVPLSTSTKWNQSVVRPSPNVQVDRTTLSVQGILPATASYVTYSGSLPTPPCTEDVPYLVYADPIKISHEQLAVLQAKVLRDIPRQTRPAQPLGNRAHPTLHHYRRPHYAYAVPNEVRELGLTGVLVAVALGFCCLGTLSSVAALFIAILTTRKPDS